MILRAVERDQHAAFEAAEHLQTAVDLAELLDRFGEGGMQQVGGGWVEQVTNVIVTGDFGDAKQAGAVRAAVALLEMSLMRQERRALHEEHRKRRHTDVAYVIGRVDTSALVRKPL